MLHLENCGAAVFTFISNSSCHPISIDQKVLVAQEAIKFFSWESDDYNRRVLGITLPPGTRNIFEDTDFFQYLFRKKVIDVNKHRQAIEELLNNLCNAKILRKFNLTKVEHALNNKNLYIFRKELTKLEQKGIMWLAPALGYEFIYETIKDGIVQIAGKNQNNGESAGTGIIFHPNYILTNSHILKDMQVHEKQIFQGIECKIILQKSHPIIDVAIIRVEQEDLSNVLCQE